MIILGIDPGTAQTGYGIIDCSKEGLKKIDHGTIKTSVNDHPPQRLKSIHLQITKVLQEHKPKVMVIESLFFNVNAKSASAVGQAIGVVKLAAAQKKIQVLEYSPLRIKKELTGKGRADKKEIQSEVRKRLRLRKIPRPTHAADALAVAICHWQTKGSVVK